MVVNEEAIVGSSRFFLCLKLFVSVGSYQPLILFWLHAALFKKIMSNLFVPVYAFGFSYAVHSFSQSHRYVG